jgi:wyosine [tRNA(Phe)-imidazoG37] synthetase (radical SAM superfamily)
VCQIQSNSINNRTYTKYSVTSTKFIGSITSFADHLLAPTDVLTDFLSQTPSALQDMIKQAKGIIGVIPERWEEAHTIKHCALSLVGEPIMYPHINEFCQGLHKNQISSFLVTNAQFPGKIAALDPVTQLYVSIDAATKDTLKAVDRPLFKDFWERFLGSLDALRDKGQRTVYRLTLVNGWNMKEVDEYVKLIGQGQPDLIEIKAVTYSGKSDASNLTIQNSPWHKVCVHANNARLSSSTAHFSYESSTTEKTDINEAMMHNMPNVRRDLRTTRLRRRPSKWM